jgi:branched-chain amino acid transport system substrate-binding protein
MALVLLVSCRSVGGPRPATTVAEDSDPPIEAGTSSATADSAAAALMARAEQALGEGRWDEAATAAAEVADRYPTARMSSRALPVLATALSALEDFGEALAVADRYTALFARSDPRAGQGAVLGARALVGQEAHDAAATRLLAATPEALEGRQEEAMEVMRVVAARLTNESLAAIVESAPSTLLSAPLLIERALALYYDGQTAEAEALARRVRDVGAPGPEGGTATAILSGNVEAFAGALPVLGAMLAETGSPGLQEFSRLIREGIEVAVQVHADQSRRPVRLSVMDDRGSPGAADAVVRRLEDEGALGVVGPLLDTSLAAAAPARLRSTVLVSPTARTVPSEHAGVYSLSGPDPSAAEALARYVRDQGFRRVVVLRPATEEATLEAHVFREVLEESGMAVSHEMAYDSGATFFQESLSEVAEIRPDALVLPLPASDVELVAPQITFFGLDTLGIQVLGTSGWAAESVASDVDARHTIGVVATAAVMPGDPTSGEERFMTEYETRLRKTLRSSVPALGHDAAALLLEAHRISGARSGEELAAAFERIRGFSGATGVLSVQDGRIVRAHHLVRYDSTGVLAPLSPEVRR